MEQDLLREAEAASAFEQLHPFFVALSQPDPASVIQVLPDLRALIPTISASGLEQCFDYFVFPLIGLLKRAVSSPATSSKCVEGVCGAFTEVLRRFQTLGARYQLKKDLFEQLFFYLCQLFACSANFGDETKLTVIECWFELLAFQESTSQLQLLVKSSPNSIAFLISQLLDIAEKERDRAVRLTALRALRRLVGRLDAHVVGAFLPGIVLQLSKVLLGDYKQGHKIVISALEVFTAAIRISLQNHAAASAAASGRVTASFAIATLPPALH
eukprot:TRINITY_DN31600_c0_g1_i1.p1 TRINITY_DN31600_c0_g1~~TRINITY_DN31600_c0_g1_i1.p1  ORF type:complete len:271 (-),score=19.41 TRINITY_DN31600_c0_g1_i1:7-819(-)